MAYIMTGEMWRDPAIPSQIYYDGIMDGYRQNGLPIEALEQAWDHVMSEVWSAPNKTVRSPNHDKNCNAKRKDRGR